MREGNKIAQERILQYLKQETLKHGYPPSVREICAALDMKSTSTVHNHLKALERDGYIRRDPTKPRAIEIAGMALRETVAVPVVGRVAAGAPILAAENIEDYFSLPTEFTHDSDCFMLTVKGDSMIEAGILEGDRLLVWRQSSALNGEIVIALLQDEATVKRYFREKDCIRLQPENHTMEPILVKDVVILGKVIGLVREIR